MTWLLNTNFPGYLSVGQKQTQIKLYYTHKTTKVEVDKPWE